MDIRVAARAGLPGVAAMVIVGGAICIASVLPAELVPISRVEPVEPPCTYGLDRGLEAPSLHLDHRFEIEQCTPMRLGNQDALFVELRLGEERDLAVFDESGDALVAPTPVPFDPYPHSDVIWNPYEIVDVDRDGNDEIIMQSDEGWIRALAVRDHELVITAEHETFGSARSTARLALAHDRLVPLRATPPVQEVAVCGDLTFVLSRPMPISQVITTYSTKTGALRLGPRMTMHVAHLDCSLRIVHTAYAMLAPHDHLETVSGAGRIWRTAGRD